MPLPSSAVVSYATHWKPHTYTQLTDEKPKKKILYDLLIFCVCERSLFSWARIDENSSFVRLDVHFNTSAQHLRIMRRKQRSQIPNTYWNTYYIKHTHAHSIFLNDTFEMLKPRKWANCLRATERASKQTNKQTHVMYGDLVAAKNYSETPTKKMYLDLRKGVWRVMERERKRSSDAHIECGFTKETNIIEISFWVHSEFLKRHNQFHKLMLTHVLIAGVNVTERNEYLNFKFDPTFRTKSNAQTFSYFHFLWTLWRQKKIIRMKH